jgi:hemoglobin-like flavoprotein
MSLNAALLRESFSAAVEREGQVTARFYELLFSRYPQVKPLFSRNAPAKQQEMLQEALLAVLDHLEDGAWLEETLGNMGQQHVAYEVKAEMYPWVCECLIAALADAASDSWSAPHEQAWTEALSAVSQLMLAGAASRV